LKAKASLPPPTRHKKKIGQDSKHVFVEQKPSDLEDDEDPITLSFIEADSGTTKKNVLDDCGVCPPVSEAIQVNNCPN